MVEGKFFVVPELPLMVSVTGELVCLEDSHDMPSILVCGRKGFGKTWCAHGLVYQAFHRKKDWRVCALNDVQGETYSWVLPQVDSPFVGQLGELGMPVGSLPLVHVFPRVTDLTRVPAGVDTVRTWFGVGEFLRNPQFFIDKKRAGLRYLIQHRKALEDYDTLEGFYGYIRENFGKHLTSLQAFITSVVASAEDQGVISDDAKTFKVLLGDGGVLDGKDVFSCCMASGVVPVLMTGPLSQDPLFWRNVVRYHCQRIIDMHVNSELFRGDDSKLFVYLDELEGLVAENDDTTRVITKMVTEGRPRQIGTLFCTQSPSKVPDSILNNVTHCVAFNLEAGQVRLLRERFGLEDFHSDYIKNLREFQCVAMTNKRFVLYDLRTGVRRVGDGKVVVGWVLPPGSLHSPPDSVLPDGNLRVASQFLSDRGMSVVDSDGVVVVGGVQEGVRVVMPGGEGSLRVSLCDDLKSFKRHKNIYRVSYLQMRDLGWKVVKYDRRIRKKEGGVFFQRGFILVPVSAPGGEVDAPAGFECYYHYARRAVQIMGNDVWANGRQEGLSGWKPIRS